MADSGWLTAAFAIGMIAGAALLALVARRRGHARISIELGDPPDRDTPPD